MKTVVKAKHDSEEEVVVKIPVLLPHRILTYLVDELGLKIPNGALEKYWSHCKAFCPWARHPDLDGSHIPLTLYVTPLDMAQDLIKAKSQVAF